MENLIKMNNVNILISSAGRRVSLIKLFQRAFKDLKIIGGVFASDMNKLAPALQVADKSFVVPGVNEDFFIEFMISLCLKNKIKLIIPTIDTELNVFSASEEIFKANGISLLVCSNEANNIFLDKNATQNFFHEKQIPSPKLYEIESSDIENKVKYPVILKPAKGHSSIGVTKVNNFNELMFFLQYLDKPIIQEFIEGEEFTIDVLIGMSGEVKCAVPRLRIETRAGEVSKAMTVNDFSIIEWCYKLASSIKSAKGCITIQCIKNNNGEIFFIEVNPRFGGGFPLSAEAGADFPKWILQIFLGLDQDENMQDSWDHEIFMLRYDQGVFINKNSM